MYPRNAINLRTIHPNLSGTLFLYGDGTWSWWKFGATGGHIEFGGKRRPRAACRPHNLHPRSTHKRFI